MKWTKNHNFHNFQKSRRIFTKQTKTSNQETSSTKTISRARWVKVDKVYQPWNSIGEMQIMTGSQNTWKKSLRIHGEVRMFKFWKINRFCRQNEIWLTRNCLKFLVDRLCLNLLMFRRRSLCFLSRMISLVEGVQACCLPLIELARRMACFIMILKLLKTD